MRVVYKKNIIEKIVDLIDNAKQYGKEIEKIVMSKREWDEVHRQALFSLYCQYNIREQKYVTTLYGITIEKETI